MAKCNLANVNLRTFHRPPTFCLKNKVHSSETLVPMYQKIRWHIQEKSNLNSLEDKSHSDLETFTGMLNIFFITTYQPKNGINPLAPNEVYTRRTAQLTSRRCILNIYSTNILTEYFKHAAHSPFLSLSLSLSLFKMPFIS